MPLNLRASNKVRKFDIGVSYRLGDTSGKLLDARNVNTVQGRLDTRYGTSRFNAVSLGGKVQSLSSFVKSDGTVYVIAKIGQELYAVKESGAHTLLKAQLSENDIHRGITVNDRHIIAVGDDEATGLYSFNGTICTQLGQDKPAAIPTGTPAATGSLAAGTYRVGYTFYASTIGFESNIVESADIVVALNERINVANIQTSAANDLIDKVYVYLKFSNGEYLFSGEISLGTASFVITDEPTSAQTPPVNNAPPIDGGGKFLTQYGTQTVYAGNINFKNDVFFSEPNLPDAFNNNGDQLVLSVPGDGAITGLATGLFSDSHLSPYLVIFKRKSIHIYSDLLGDGAGNFVCINDKIGCVSHDTIVLKNGVVYFLSEEGWRAIFNGKLITAPNGEAVTLGNGDIDDIFRSPGYIYEVNRSNVSGAFSVYYPALNQYLTWVSEGINDAFTKTYVYEFEVGGFKPWEFATPGTCACLSKNANGNDIVLIGTENGFVMRHSIYEQRTDKDASNTDTAIAAFALFPWIPGDQDSDATYNFREIIVKSVVAGTIELRTLLNYNSANVVSGSMNFASLEAGFILGTSVLGVDSFSDDRGIIPSRFDINRVGESIAFGFYQAEIGGNLGLVSLQLDLSKNGNRNIPENETSDDVFGSEEESLYPSNSESQLRNDLEQAVARIALLEGMLDTGNTSIDGAWRFRVVSGNLVVQVRESGSWVDRFELTPVAG